MVTKTNVNELPELPEFGKQDAPAQETYQELPEFPDFVPTPKEYRAEDTQKAVVNVLGNIAGWAGSEVAKPLYPFAKASEDVQQRRTFEAETEQINVPGRPPIDALSPLALIRARDTIDTLRQDPKFAEWITKPSAELTEEQRNNKAKYVAANEAVKKQMELLTGEVRKPGHLVTDQELEQFTIRPPDRRSLNNAGTIALISPDELGAIARKYGADPAVLEQRLGPARAAMEGDENDPLTVTQNALGYASQAWGDIGGAVDMTMLDQPEQKALRAVKSVISGRQSGWVTAMDIGVGIGGNLATTSFYMPKLVNGLMKAGLLGKVGSTLASTGKTAAQVMTEPKMLAATTIADLTDNVIQALATAKNYQQPDQSFSDALIIPLALGGGGAVIGPLFSATNKGAQKFTKLTENAPLKLRPKAYMVAVDKAEQDAPKLVAAVQNDLQTNKTLPRDKVSLDENTKEVARLMGGSGNDAELMDFMQSFIDKEPQALVAFVQRNHISKQFDEMLKNEMTGVVGPSLAGKVLDIFSSGFQKAGVYDKRLGFDSQNIQLLFHRDARLNGIVSTDRGYEALETMKSMERLKPQNVPADKFMADVMDYVDGSGQYPKGTQAPQHIVDAADALGKLLESWEKFYNATGKVNIQNVMQTKVAGKLGGGARGYVPRRLLPPQELAMSIEARLAKAVKGAAAGDLGPSSGLLNQPSIDTKFWENLMKTKDNEDLVKFMANLEGVAEIPVHDFPVVLKKWTNPGGSYSRGGSDGVRYAQALNNRVGDMPNWAKDRNLGRTLLGYIEDMNTTLYVEPHVRSFEHLARMAKKVATRAGADFEKDPAYQFFRGQADTLKFGGSAQIGGLGQYVTKKLAQLESGLRQAEKAKIAAGDTKGAGRLRALREAAPGVQDYLRENLYVNVLGITNLKATLENFVSPILQASTEEGLVYSTQLAGRSIKKAYKKFAESGGWKASFTGREKALSPGRQAVGAPTERRNRELVALARGEYDKAKKIQARGAVSASTFTNTLMATFNISERFSREMAYAMGETLADDLVKGNARALAAVKRMPGTLPESITKMTENVNKGLLPVEILQDRLGLHLVESTVLHYDDIAKSEAAKWAGAWASMFTRWPSESIGRLNYALRSEGPARDGIRGEVTGAAKGMAKYLGRATPGLTMLQVADMMINEEVSLNPRKEQSGRTTGIIGPRGMMGLNPWTSSLQALMDIGTGGVNAGKYTPPPVGVVGAGVNATIAAFGDDEEKWNKAKWKVAGQVGNFALPGWGLVNGAFKQWQQIVDNNKKPEPLLED